MSSAPDAHAEAHAADASHDHDFDGEPAQTLGADEPRTPGWVPAVGLSLFAAAAVAMLASGGGDVTRPKPPEAPVQIEPVAPPEPVRAAPAAPGARGAAAPPGSGMGRQISKEQMDALRKRIEDARSRGQLPAPSGAPKAGRAPR